MKLEPGMSITNVLVVPTEAELPEEVRAMLLKKLFGKTRLDDIVIRDLRGKNGLK